VRMPTFCSVCSSSQQGLIDRRLLAGESLGALVAEYALSSRDLAHHRDAHVLKRAPRSAPARGKHEESIMITTTRTTRLPYAASTKTPRSADHATRASGQRDARKETTHSRARRELMRFLRFEARQGGVRVGRR
jgi:hypothetical protein